MKKIIIISIAVILVAAVLLAACSSKNAAPSTDLKGPSASLSGTPYITAGPSSTVTIKVTPLPQGTQSAVPTLPGSALASPAAS